MHVARLFTLFVVSEVILARMRTGPLTKMRLRACKQTDFTCFIHSLRSFLAPLTILNPSGLLLLASTYLAQFCHGVSLAIFDSHITGLQACRSVLCLLYLTLMDGEGDGDVRGVEDAAVANYLR